ncbi:MAG: alpha/beta hydrolase [Erysipelotrichaceae bacterium]|nr:alpha/beta hydrolase [Erysipelotrichaceae bacterium]
MYHQIKVEEERPCVLVYNDIVYAIRRSRWGRDYRPLRMHIQMPMYFHRENRPTPLLIWLEGGGWRNSSAALRISEMGFFALHGIAVANVEYSVDADNVWPVQLQDVKEAIAYLRDHHEEFMIDPDRIAIAGDSAGGHLAAMAALTGDLKAAICYYTPGDFPNMKEGADAFKLEDLLVGKDIHSDEKLMKEVDLREYVTKDSPPFMFFHGDNDALVDPSSSKCLYDLLEENGVEAEYYLVEGAGHCDTLFTQESIQQIVLDFLNRHV